MWRPERSDVKRTLRVVARTRGGCRADYGGHTSNQPVELAGEISRLRARRRRRLVGWTSRATSTSNATRPQSLYVVWAWSLRSGVRERGHDYPFLTCAGRKRNIEAFLDRVAEGRVQVEPLITHRSQLTKPSARTTISGHAQEQPYWRFVALRHRARGRTRIERAVSTGSEMPWPQRRPHRMIGAGGYARAMLLPHFKSCGAEFEAIATATGVTAMMSESNTFPPPRLGRRRSDRNNEVNLVVIATRHDRTPNDAPSARTREACLVEKPLSLNEEELENVLGAAARAEDS